MKPVQVRVCLVSLPGPICDATYATLTNTAHVTLAEIAFGALSATRLLRRVAPDLVLLDANLPDDEVHSLLEWIRSHDVQTRTLVATLNTRQLQEVLGKGAGAAVPRNVLPDRLAEMVDEIAEAKSLSAGNPARQA